MVINTTTWHFPPELFNLVVDTIPKLCKSKKDVLLFFKGAGTPDTMMTDLQLQLQKQKETLYKYDIVRTLLERLNEANDKMLSVRRELIKRIVEFSNFETCYDSDRLKAKGLVADIAQIVKQKDAFTRMEQEKNRERSQRLQEENKKLQARQAREAKIESAKSEFYSLFSSNLSPQARGKQLESALNNLFKAYDFLISEAFHITGSEGEGIIEQIDGAIKLENHLYLVEMKWYEKSIGAAEIAQPLVRLMNRAESRGIFISYSDFTEPAIAQVKEFLNHKMMILVTLKEIVNVLEQKQDLATFLSGKVKAAIVDRNPYFQPL